MYDQTDEYNKNGTKFLVSPRHVKVTSFIKAYRGNVSSMHLEVGSCTKAFQGKSVLLRHVKINSLTKECQDSLLPRHVKASA